MSYDTIICNEINYFISTNIHTKCIPQIYLTIVLKLMLLSGVTTLFYFIIYLIFILLFNFITYFILLFRFILLFISLLHSENTRTCSHTVCRILVSGNCQSLLFIATSFQFLFHEDRRLN